MRVLLFNLSVKSWALSVKRFTSANTTSFYAKATADETLNV
jgi:hypothetical protein